MVLRWKVKPGCEGNGLLKEGCMRQELSTSLILVMPLFVGFMQSKNGCKNQKDGGGGEGITSCVKPIVKSKCLLRRRRKYYVL